MADPTQVQEAVTSAWESDREATRKSAQDHAEDRVDAMFDAEGKVRKDAGESDVVASFGRGVAITEEDLARARDLGKSKAELLREIRDELRDRGHGVRADGGHKGNGNRESVSKSNVVLKESDVDGILAMFREETGVSLADPNGVGTFREWLEERIANGHAGPREEKLLEELEGRFEELKDEIRDRVAETADGEGEGTEKSRGRDTVRKSMDGRGAPRTDGGIDRDNYVPAEDLPAGKRRRFEKAVKESTGITRQSWEELAEALDDGMRDDLPV